MSTRNPMNERYQNNDVKPAGKTRKSAASAKPVSKAASSVRVESKKKEQPSGLFNKRKAAAGQKDKLIPDTPEYQTWRKVWIGCIVMAIAVTVVGFILRNTMPESGASIVLIIIGDVLLIASIIIDVFKLAKMRTKYAQKVRMSKSKADKEKVRAANAEAKANANSDRAKEVEAVKKVKEEKPKKKKSLNPFSTKNI